MNNDPLNTDNVEVQFIKNEDQAIIDEVKNLLNEYGDYMYTDLKLVAGKENFFNDLENFPGTSYVQPSGMFVVAKTGDTVLGCVGVKKFDAHCCEMKRMYVREIFRGRGIGKLLCNFVMKWCRKSGYNRILLDTNIEMVEAVTLYKKCGFKEIEAYCMNENDHPIYMEFLL